MAEAGAPDSDLPERIAREHLRLAQRQIGRMPLSNVLTDVFLCWLVFRLGFSVPALLWFAALFAVQVGRWRHVLRTQKLPTSDPQAALHWLSAYLLLMGVLRAVMLPLLFTHPVQVEHFMLTTVYLGLIAGTGASVGGQMRPFFAYVALVGGGLATVWALQGSADGLWIGALIIGLITVLAGGLRDQSRGLQQLVKLALDNEHLAASLRVARDAAEAASLSKTRFFAAASHDLRQPLHALSINATTLELLASRQADPLIKELSNSINRALSQSNGLLDSLLEISKLDAQAVKPNLQTVDLADLLSGVREEFAALAAHKGLQMRLVLPTPPPLATSDPLLLRRILTNLVGNAVKFTTTGGVTLSARYLDPHLTPADAVPQLLIAVIDSGRGIAVDQQVRVFEEFYQIENTARDRNLGLGLGLAIVQRTASLLGAPLRLTSTAGSGTVVELQLPVSAAAARLQDSPLAADAVQADMLPGLRVLVVDDELEIQLSMQALLTQLGCDVRCADGQAQALLLVEAGFQAQVLLIDHRLRNERGSDVIAALQARLGPVPAVLVTGDTEPALLHAARAAGHRVVHKPVQGQVLARLLQELASEGAPPA